MCSRLVLKAVKTFLDTPMDVIIIRDPKYVISSVESKIFALISFFHNRLNKVLSNIILDSQLAYVKVLQYVLGKGNVAKMQWARPSSL